MIDAKLFNSLVTFLQDTEKDNTDLLNYIHAHKDNLFGPILIEENKIQRTLGPESNMLNHESENDFKIKVDRIAKRIIDYPKTQLNLLCEKFNDTYYILDGNHTFEALKTTGVRNFWVIYTNDSVIYKQMNLQS
jgi:hypothetical protein